MFNTRSSIVLLALLAAGCGGGGGGSGDLIITPEAPDVEVEVEPGDDPVPGEIDADFVERSDVRGLEQLYPYRPDSDYAQILKPCVLIEQARDACTLEVLPFINQTTRAFTRDDIMDRLLVTHDWMGERFEWLLDSAPEHMLSLFGSVTSIVIGSTVRPSSYWAGTGGIKLDPEDLWLSVEEKANVSIEEDYRSGYGDDLQFWALGSLRDGTESAVSFYSLTSREERVLNDIKVPMFRLLYHELAHAIDYLPNASVPLLDARLRPAEAIDALSEYRLSSNLNNDLPLNSQVLHDLAGVNYGGDEATLEQRSYSPAYVGSEMANDGAMRFYAYRTEREDFATLFTMAMMKYDFGFDYHLAFVDKPADEDNYNCSELTVGWGAKNRLADEWVKRRAKWVMESIYGPSDEIENLFDRLVGEAVPMTAGVDWCSNTKAGLGSVVASAVSNKSLSGVNDSETLASEQSRIKSRLQLEGERMTGLH